MQLVREGKIKVEVAKSNYQKIDKSLRMFSFQISDTSEKTIKKTVVVFLYHERDNQKAN